MQFEWDNRKAKLNVKKHRVSFEEASTVFDDDFAKVFFDEVHSDEEIREIIVGYSLKNRMLLVCSTETGHERVRIITAREPTPLERKDYED
jgi:uncharacterized DUF497 family protein